MRVIAIDGPAGSGKSTVARTLAKCLGLDYLDTGAMYRGVAFAALRRGVDPEDSDVVARMATDIEIDVAEVVTVDGVDATIEIRGPEVTRAVSTVAANPEVRRELRRRQREWAAAHGGGVIEGRDIGSVVFPDAELKVYLTASDAERAGRRSKEVLDLDYDTVAADIARRDHTDANRAAAPLVVADGAVTVDTTGLSIEQVVERVLRLLPQSEETPGGAASVTDAPVTDPPATESPSTDSAPPVPPTDPAPAASAVSVAQDPSTTDAPAGAPTNRPSWRTAPAAMAEDRPLTRGERAFYQFARAVLRAFGRLYWRVSVSGSQNVPRTGPFVVSPVHRSNIDTVLMAFVTRRQLRYMAKDSLWKHRWSARLLTALGGFPVNRSTADRDALRTCESALRRGEPVVIFPEGTRKEGPVVTDLFQGAAYVALRTGVPIVPVGIGGSADAMPRGTMLLRPAKVAIVIGTPIQPPPRQGAGARGSRRQVREVTASLQAGLQDVFEQAQRRATPRRGA